MLDVQQQGSFENQAYAAPQLTVPLPQCGGMCQCDDVEPTLPGPLPNCCQCVKWIEFTQTVTKTQCEVTCDM